MRGLVLLIAFTPLGVVSAQPPDLWPLDFEPIPAPCPCPPPAVRSAASPSVSRYATEHGDRVNVVLRWNALALNAIKAERTPPPLAARHLAVMHLAMYDACSPGRRTHQPFHVRVVGPAEASSESAVAAAAWRVLRTIYPKQAGTFDDALDELPDLEGLDEGVRWGRRSPTGSWPARRGLASARRTTGRERRPGAGPTPPAYKSPLLPGWGKAPLFALRSAEAVRPPEPPALNSLSCGRLPRVKALGSVDSRPAADQTEIANFWADGEGTVTLPGQLNRLAATVARTGA